MIYSPYIVDINVSCIYAICAPDDKFYIGSTRNLDQRWKWHMNLLKKNKHSNPHLQSHFNKYPNGWSVLIVEQLPVTELLVKEQEYLNFWFGTDVCLNTNPSAILPPNRKGIPNPKVSAAMKGKVAWNKGVQASTAMRIKNRIAHLGKIASNETKLKMSLASLGKSKTALHRANISSARKGMLFSKQHRDNIRIARLKYLNKI